MFLHQVAFAYFGFGEVTALKYVTLRPILLNKVHIGVGLNQLPPVALSPLVNPLIRTHLHKVVGYVLAFPDQLHHSPQCKQVAEYQIKQTEQIEPIIVHAARMIAILIMHGIVECYCCAQHNRCVNQVGHNSHK